MMLILITLILTEKQNVFAVCAGHLHNPVTEVCWECIFPIKIAGITISKNPADQVDNNDAASSPVCVCPTPLGIPRIGIPISFWEPARYIETVKDAYCFPSLGFGMPNPTPGFLDGSAIYGGGSQEGSSVFRQVHFFIYPIWSLMELFIDSVCIEHSGFDLGYMTEVDPSWNDDELALIMFPETLLFANLPAQLSCMADAVASNAGKPLAPMYWCMGSWGSTYPITGHICEHDITQASLGIGARMIYKLARIGAICDTGVNICACVPTLIWVKNNYKFNIAKPVHGSHCIPVGRSALIWGSGKNFPLPVSGDACDNFMYIVFRKRVCCVL